MDQNILTLKLLATLFLAWVAWEDYDGVKKGLDGTITVWKIIVLLVASFLSVALIDVKMAAFYGLAGFVLAGEAWGFGLRAPADVFITVAATWIVESIIPAIIVAVLPILVRKFIKLKGIKRVRIPTATVIAGVTLPLVPVAVAGGVPL